MKIEAGKSERLKTGKIDRAAAGSGAEQSVSTVGLKGSECSGLKGATRIGSAPSDEKFQVTVLLNRAEPLKMSGDEVQRLTHKDFETTYGASPKDLEAVRAFAKKNGLSVIKTDSATRTVVLQGKTEDYNKAFGVQLDSYKTQKGEIFRAYSGKVHLPSALAQKVQGVFGLENRSRLRTNLQFKATPKIIGPFSKSQVAGSYTPLQVAQLYNFPKGTNGAGQTIGILEFGGGYTQSNIQNYFKQLGMPAPNVKSVSVDGAKNAPSAGNGADGEVQLDIEVAGAVAPKANIVVYFAPNGEQGFIDAINTAIHDKVNHPSVLSLSWGADEGSWSPQAVQALNSVLKEAAALGITVCVASGDNGSSDGVNDGKNHVDFPASSPYALGCGGTSLQSSGGKITKETAWNNEILGGLLGGGASGGGVSDVFPLPSWQKSAHVPAPTVKGGGRGVPDVSADADPDTGYDVLIDGQQGVVGGTSAAAPLWAGLIARLNQGLGHNLGFVNPLLYKIYGSPLYHKAFHDITQGNNGAFKAGAGWDPVTGLGSPDGEGLLAALKEMKTPFRASKTIIQRSAKKEGGIKETTA
jgi:kumamolisin